MSNMRKQTKVKEFFPDISVFYSPGIPALHSTGKIVFGEPLYLWRNCYFARNIFKASALYLKFRSNPSGNMLRNSGAAVS